MRPLQRFRFPIGGVNILPSPRRTFATSVDAPANGRERVVILGSGWAGESDTDAEYPNAQPLISGRLRPFKEARYTEICPSRRVSQVLLRLHSSFE